MADEKPCEPDPETRDEEREKGAARDDRKRPDRSKRDEQGVHPRTVPRSTGGVETR